MHNTYPSLLSKSIAALFIMVGFISCFKERRSDKAANKMQEFVIDISKYARGFDNDFIVIPQNGVELCLKELDVANGLHSEYMNAIDGIGVEELFYDGSNIYDGERLEIIDLVAPSKKVMVAEFVNETSNVSDAIHQNYSRGYICFPRVSGNYDYIQIPDTAIHANDHDIHSLHEAQNYLYLISTDNYSSKQQFLEAIQNTNFDVVLIDLFFEEEAFTASEIASLKTKENGADRLVIAYMNIGSAEKFRYYWKNSWGLHHPLWIKRRYEGYDDEFWVKFWKNDWQEIIYGNDDSYTKKIIDASFDGVYLDNVEAYYFLYFKD